jgi:uncharacterized protein with von Willebrand factor type A (vWA) domain
VQLPLPDRRPFIVNLLAFGRVLRRAGFDVAVGSMLDLIEALTQVDVRSRDDVFFTMQALLVRRQEQLAAFALLFDVFWRDRTNPFSDRNARVNATDPGTRAAVAAALLGLTAPDSDEAHGDDRRSALRTWSDAEGLSRKDIGLFTDDEMARAQRALDRMSWIAGERRTRRWIPGRGPRLDLRRALARGLRTGGDIVAIPTRRRRVRPRRLVLLADVSGSMERYSRLLLHFAHGVGQRHRRLEVFLFSTRLTRVTHQLRQRRLAHAAAAVTTVVPDWSGGTRIGAALQEFHRRWSRRVLREGAVVLLISDGWDRGDPAVLAAQVARLQRSSHRLIWLNPLIGSQGYEPLTRGLQAALPHVDDFLPVRTLADLADLALHLESLAGSRTTR